MNHSSDILIVCEVKIDIMKAGRKILLLENDPDTVKLVEDSLSTRGCVIKTEGRFEEAMNMLKSYSPDLIILDIILDDTYGLEICRVLKRNPDTVDIPILILSSRNDESDIVAALELGAEDYITKPFNPNVLNARVHSILSRNSMVSYNESSVIQYGGLKIDPRRFEIKLEDKLLTVTRSEFRILQRLWSRPGWVFSRHQIIEAMHGEKTPITIRSVDVMIVGIRNKLGSKAELIETVRGVGYRLKEVEC